MPGTTGTTIQALQTDGDGRVVINGKLIHLACQGDARAQFLLGRIHLSDNPQLRDHEKALKWLRAAAEQGIVEAQIQLGLLLLTGDAGEANPEEASQWYCTAGLNGSDEGLFRLAMMFLVGTGVERDLVSAYAWFSMAAAAGRRDASKQVKSLRNLLTPEQLADAEQLVLKIRKLKEEQTAD